MAELLFSVLLQGLKLWNTKESTKYTDRLLGLQKSWLEEYEKPRAKRNNQDLDDIEAELVLISKAFVKMGEKK